MLASRSQWHRYTGAVLVTLASLSGGTVWAQQPRQAPQATQPAHFSSHDLKSFAKAAVDVRRVAQKAKASWRAAKTKHDKRAVARAAQRQEVQAIKAHGMTVRKYEAIVMAVRTDAGTRTKVMSYINQYSKQRVE